MPEDLESIKAKYLDKLKSEYSKKVTSSLKEVKIQKTNTLNNFNQFNVESVDYIKFKEEMMPTSLSIYEKLCKWFSFVEIAPDQKTEQEIKDAIEVTHLDLTPKQVYSFAINFSLIYMIFFILITLFYGFVFDDGNVSYFIIVFFIITGLLMMYLNYTIIFYIASSWRMKTSNQMILAVFYMVTYLRHTSNLERAVHFASKFISPPLSIDFKKILWDVEVGNYPTIKDSIENYLKSWEKFNPEFVDSFHLIESSLFEPTEDRRVALLDKSLETILDGTFENMLHFANGLRSPITILNMLGVVMPILGLVILPLVVSFMDTIQWYHIALLYNIIIPIIVFFFGKNILANRPSGYGSNDITDLNPELKKMQKMELNIGSYTLYVDPLIISILIFCTLIFVGFIPQIIHYMNPDFNWIEGTFDLLSYVCPSSDPQCTSDKLIGPFGIIAIILSFFTVLAFSISIGFYYWYKSRKLVELRERLEKLDNEFSTALFQLSNKLSDGMPSEIAFGKVAEIMPETQSGKFFRRINDNIANLGMNVKQAIFDEKIGALKDYPSPLISSSMQVLVESSNKGPRIAATALSSIARYVKEIHRVNERLQDVLSEVVSSMDSQIKFLTPVIASIVVGLTTMMAYLIANINKLTGSVEGSIAGEEGASLANSGGIPAILKQSSISSYHFQVIIGLYVVEIIIVLSYLLSNIKDGDDVILRNNALGNNSIKSILLYVFISAVVVVLFNILAALIVESIGVTG